MINPKNKQMAVTDTDTKFMTFKEVKDKTKLELTEEQLVIIENVYIKSRKNSIFLILAFRFLNAFFAIGFIVVFFIFKNSKFSEYLFLIMTTVFFFYNSIHCWNNILDYKRTKLDTFKGFTVGK